MTDQESIAEIDVQFADDLLATYCPDEEVVIALVQHAMQSVSYGCTVRMCGLDEMTTLNGQFRDKPKPTNVLSFTADIPPEFANGYLGDILICMPVVMDEAKDQGKTLDAHFAHMVVHGVLHLRGYDHIDDEDAEKMEQLEIQLLALKGINNPYQHSAGDSNP